MKKLNLYISEALVTSKPIGVFNKHKYHPTTKGELSQNIITELKMGNTDLNCIDTSAITDMSHLFWEYDNGIDIDKYNIDISNWDVSNVKNMRAMFFECKNFNSDISQWDVSKVKDMSQMFYGCTQFNCDLSNWDISNVTDISYMFDSCGRFNCDLSTWDVRNVKNMESIFFGCEKFNSDLSSWDVSNVKNMDRMFYECHVFEGKGLDNWDVHNMNSAIGMFYNCKNFDSDLSNWEVHAKYVNFMFNKCPKLNAIYGETPRIKNGKFIKL